MIRVPTNQVACEPIFDANITKSGRLFIPDQAQERCDQGIVKYIGPDVKLVKPTDMILFSGYSGTLVELEDEGLLIILQEEFITAIVHPPATDVPGLFFKDRDGTFFTATYEMAMELIADSMKNSDWHRKFDVKAITPTKESYDA